MGDGNVLYDQRLIFIFAHELSALSRSTIRHIDQFVEMGHRSRYLDSEWRDCYWSHASDIVLSCRAIMEHLTNDGLLSTSMVDRSRFEQLWNLGTIASEQPALLEKWAKADENRTHPIRQLGPARDRAGKPEEVLWATLSSGREFIYLGETVDLGSLRSELQLLLQVLSDCKAPLS